MTLGVHPSSLTGIGVFSRVKRPGHELDHFPHLMSNYEYPPLYLAHACVFPVWRLVEGTCYLALTFSSSLQNASFFHSCWWISRYRNTVIWCTSAWSVRIACWAPLTGEMLWTASLAWGHIQVEFFVFWTLHCCEVNKPVEFLSLHSDLFRTSTVSHVIRAENDVTKETYTWPLQRTQRPPWFMCRL